jgi:hypothetical protein
MLEAVMWNDDDAITHDPLRVCITNLTQTRVFTNGIRLHDSICFFSKLLFSNFLHFVIPSWRMLKFVKWDDDNAIGYDPLRIAS